MRRRRHNGMRAIRSVAGAIDIEERSDAGREIRRLTNGSKNKMQRLGSVLPTIALIFLLKAAPAYPAPGPIFTLAVDPMNPATLYAGGANGTFKSVDEIKKLYDGVGVTGDQPIIAYCRIGERSSHSWFALKYLLGYNNVKNYDGSWTEWGNMVAVPVEKGT